MNYWCSEDSSKIDESKIFVYIFSLFNIRPLHVVLWVSLSGTLSSTLRIVFRSHLVLCVSMRLIVRNNFIFCFLHYFSNVFSKFWYFIIVINPVFLANSENSLTSRMRSELLEISEHFNRTIFFMWRHLMYWLYFLSSMRGDFQLSSANVTLNEPLNVPFNANLNEIPTWRGLLVKSATY